MSASCDGYLRTGPGLFGPVTPLRWPTVRPALNTAHAGITVWRHGSTDGCILMMRTVYFTNTAEVA